MAAASPPLVRRIQASIVRRDAAYRALASRIIRLRVNFPGDRPAARMESDEEIKVPLFLSLRESRYARCKRMSISAGSLGGGIHKIASRKIKFYTHAQKLGSNQSRGINQNICYIEI